MYSNVWTQHMVTLKTQFEVAQAPTNVSARKAVILPVSQLQYNEDITTTAC